MGRELAALELSEAERSELGSLVGRRSTAQAWRCGLGSCWPALKAGRTRPSRPGWGLTGRRSASGAGASSSIGLDGLRDEPRSGTPRTIEDARIEAVIVRTLETHAAGRHPLEFARHGAGQRAVDLDRAAHLARLRPAAAPAGDLQAVHRPRLRRQGARRRRPLRLAARARHRAVRRREVADPGARPQPADAADAARPGRRGAATTTSAMAPPRCSPPSTSPPAGSSASATGAIAPPSSASSSTRSRPPCQPISTSISSWTITPPTRRPLIRNWLAKRPRWHVHLTPTSSSWLNQVERFFALLTERKIRRGIYRSVAALRPTSTPSSNSTTPIQSPSAGPNPPTTSSLPSSASAYTMPPPTNSHHETSNF